MDQANNVGAWLRHGVLLAAIIALLAGGYLLYRTARVLQSVEQSITTVTADVKVITGTVAQLSRDVEQIRQDIRETKQKMKESVPVDEAKSVLDEAMAIAGAMKQDESQLTDDAKAEIHYLLNAVLTSEMSAEADGKACAIGTLYFRLAAKYKLKERSLTSAEDFIEHVATTTTLGRPYYLIDGAGEKIALPMWLTERLAARRAEQTGD